MCRLGDEAHDAVKTESRPVSSPPLEKESSSTITHHERVEEVDDTNA